jgi:glycosyltransferase involved in cell wall biosynthesis
MPVIEAGAAGKPVIASDLDGMSELVLHGTTGLLVRANGVAELAEAISELAEAPPRRREMGRAGRERCRQLFTYEKETESLMSLYDTILQGRGAAEDQSFYPDRGGAGD